MTEPKSIIAIDRSEGFLAEARAKINDYWIPFLGKQGAAPADLASLSDEKRDSIRDVLQARLPFNCESMGGKRSRVKIMKSNSNKQTTGTQKTNWTTLLIISLGIIFGSILIFGTLFSTGRISQKIVMAYHCPGAVAITEKLGPITQVGSDPNSRGQTVKGICEFADGSTKVIGNDDYAVTSILGSLALGAVFGAVSAIIFIPIYIVWKKKTIASSSRRP